MAPLLPTVVGLEVAAPPLVLEQREFFETFFKPRYAFAILSPPVLN